MNRIKKLLLLLSLFSLVGCSKPSLVGGGEGEKIIVPKTDVNLAFVTGAFRGSFASQEVIFDFKAGKLDLTVGNDLVTIKGGNYKIIKDSTGKSSEMLILSGVVTDRTVELLISTLFSKGTKYNIPDIIAKATADSTAVNAAHATVPLIDFTNRDIYSTSYNAAENACKAVPAYACKGLFAQPEIPEKPAQNGQPKIPGIPAQQTHTVAFPILIESAFTLDGVKGLSLKFEPGLAFFNQTEAAALTALEADAKFKITADKFTGAVPTAVFDFSGSDYTVD